MRAWTSIGRAGADERVHVGDGDENPDRAVGCGSATDSWSRSRESSLSIEAHSSPRRSRTDSSRAGAIAFASSIARGGISGCRPRSIMAR